MVHEEQTNANLAKLTPEEYLDRFAVTTYTKDVITLLLENRPEDCLYFMSNYFSNVVHGSSYMIRSYRYIKLTSRNRSAFFDNLVAAYHSLNSSTQKEKEKDENGQIGITTQDMIKLVKHVCQDFPHDLLLSIVKVLNNGDGKHIQNVVTFPEFAAAINASLLYEEFVQHSEAWFKSLDVNQTGKISHQKISSELIKFIESARNDDYPKIKEIKKILKQLNIKSLSDGMVSYRDFMMTLFACTVPPESTNLGKIVSTP